MSNPTISLRSRELLHTYSRNPSIKLRNQIVQLNVGLVRKVASRISKQCAEPYEDLEQIGFFGLIRAIERFNPYQGYAFSSFAIPYIRGEILHYLRDKGSALKIPRRWQELYAKGKKLRKNLTNNDTSSVVKDKEIAQALGVSLQEWNECQLAFQHRTLVSLDVTVNQTVDCSTTFGDTLADSRCHNQEKLQEEQLELQAAINQLDEKCKQAIESVYLRQMSRKDAAKKIGISPMTVTRHLKKGIEQLENILQSYAA